MIFNWKLTVKLLSTALVIATGQSVERLCQFGIEVGLSNGTSNINTAKLYCMYAIFLRSFIFIEKIMMRSIQTI
jgi:hypothetical protein